MIVWQAETMLTSVREHSEASAAAMSERLSEAAERADESLMSARSRSSMSTAPASEQRWGVRGDAVGGEQQERDVSGGMRPVNMGCVPSGSAADATV